MKPSSLFALFVTLSILAAPTFAQDTVRPNPQVEAKAAQALLNAEIKLQKMIPLNSQQKPEYDSYENYFNKIAIAFAHLGRTESALKATQFMTPHSASETTSEVLRLSVRRSTIFGDVKRAASLIPQIKNNNAKADALLTVARAYLRNDNYPAAQKVLFQVTPLVPKDFRALLYTASLFAKSGNYEVSKRLFDRAREMIVPIPDAYESEKDFTFTDIYGGNNTAPNQIHAFNYYALNAGFVDEWQQLRKDRPKLSRLLNLESLQALLDMNEIDIAIKAARETVPDDRVIRLILIAYYIAAEYPDRAYSLLNEASDAVPLAAERIKKTFGEASVPWVKQSFYMDLALGYNKVGKEKDAQKWLQQLKQDIPKNKQALMQLQYYIVPLSLSHYFNKKGTFPPQKLLEINDKVQPYLRELHNNELAFNFLQQLINAQIAAGQIPQARGNIKLLDKAAREKLSSAKERADFSGAIEVAKLWKKAGDQKRLDAILQTIFNTPQQSQHFSKFERIRTFVNHGFVDEGLRLFHLLPMYEGRPQSVMPGLPYALAVAHPNQFPYELLKASQPYTEASNISKFIDGLTNALFQTSSDEFAHPISTPSDSARVVTGSNFSNAEQRQIIVAPAPDQPPQKSQKSPKQHINWVGSFGKALQVASKQDKPVMVDFYADWCGPSHYLDDHIFTSPDVIAGSRRFVNVRVDTEKQKKLTKHYKVIGFPTVIFMDGNRNVLWQQEGAPEKSSYFADDMKSIYRKFEQKR